MVQRKLERKKKKQAAEGKAKKPTPCYGEGRGVEVEKKGAKECAVRKLKAKRNLGGGGVFQKALRHQQKNLRKKE